MSDENTPFTHFLPQRDLPLKTPRPLKITPTAKERAAIAATLDLRSCEAFVFDAVVSPVGDGIWAVEGEVHAKVTQNCVVTLSPIKSTLAEPVQRLFSTDVSEELPYDFDIDMEDDDPPEPVGEGIDLGAIATEAASLALDPYPRAPGAAFETVRSAPPGVTPMTPDQAKPFAGLAALKKSLEDGD